MRTVRIGDLPEDMQVLLSQFAQDSGGVTDFKGFEKIRLPVFMVPLEEFPEVPDTPWDDRELENYLETPIEEFPPVVVAHRIFIDGGHRLWAARRQGARAIQTMDASSITGPSIRNRGFFTFGPMRFRR